jgi:predicted RNase H-like nuclease
MNRAKKRTKRRTRKGSRSTASAERQRLIRGLWSEDVERCETLFARSECGLDDLYDAFAALWSARRVASGVAEQLPEIAPRDARGLPMRIIA